MRRAEANLRVKAGTNSINYLPQTVACVTGLFEDRDLKVEVQVVGPGPAAAAAVLSGDAEVALGGIWRPAIYLPLERELVAFANILQRCPAFLVGRHGSKTANAGRLRSDATIIVCTDVPSPALVLDMLLLDLTDGGRGVRLLKDFTPAEGVDLFRDGLGDFIYLSQPWVEKLIDSGTAEIFVSMAEAIGPLPWSVYMTTPETLRASEEALLRFVDGLAEALTWIEQSDQSEIVRAVSASYPDYDAAALGRVITRAKGLAAWPPDTRILPEPLRRWSGILSRSGLIPVDLDWSLVVAELPDAAVARAGLENEGG